MKKMPEKYYPLLKVNGQDVGMNVRLYKGRRYWNFYCRPDTRLDEPYSDRIFSYLCDLDGFMYSLDLAFYEFPKVALSGYGTLLMSSMWLSGELLTRDHVMYILEQAALPHWLKAGKTIEDWLGERTWDQNTLCEMCNEIYDPEQNGMCRAQYLELAKKRYLKRKNANRQPGLS